MSADDFEADLLTGLAGLLAAESVGTWRPTGSYAALETGIVIDAMPEGLNRVIQLALYPVADDPMYAGDEIGLQVITRWEGANPLPCRQLDVKVFNRLQGRTHFALSTGVTIATCSRRSGASLGLDASKRWSRSSNYYLRVFRPTTHRL